MVKRKGKWFCIKLAIWKSIVSHVLCLVIKHNSPEGYCLIRRLGDTSVQWRTQHRSHNIILHALPYQPELPKRLERRGHTVGPTATTRPRSSLPNANIHSFGKTSLNYSLCMMSQDTSRDRDLGIERGSLPVII